eukprot:TRINITY_DN11284_c0_g1_i1.p1 TRINITY_DN11284_c0_g1~~TRINITY_DN11284_c0_g1_i1.p1  ORF type:complete len:269 (-),score=67.65 TRINITY_DN11284_c0_g1_i1:3-728(-)
MKEFAFEIVTANKNVILSASSAQEMIDWNKAIQKASGVEPIDSRTSMIDEMSNRIKITEVDVNSRDRRGTLSQVKNVVEREDAPMENLNGSQKNLRVLKEEDIESPKELVRSNHESERSSGNSNSGRNSNTNTNPVSRNQDWDELEVANNQRSMEYRGSRSSIREDEISNSESRYFKKFGLNPPPVGQSHSSSSFDDHYERDDVNQSLLGHSSSQKNMAQKRRSKNEDIKEKSSCCSCTIL